MIGDFFLLSLYWAVTSIPLVTIGASTTALYYVHLKRLRGEGGSLWRLYIRSFRENWKQATFVWLIFAFLLVDVVLLLDRMRLSVADITAGGWISILLAAVGILWLGMFLYVFPLIAMFRQTTGEVFAGAFGLAFSHLPSTLLFVAILALMSYGVLWFPALILVDPGLISYLISLRMNSIFTKQMEKQERRHS